MQIKVSFKMKLFQLILLLIIHSHYSSNLVKQRKIKKLYNKDIWNYGAGTESQQKI
jgi:hypothetical protein